jgi:hypothetical protein
MYATNTRITVGISPQYVSEKMQQRMHQGRSSSEGEQGYQGLLVLFGFRKELQSTNNAETQQKMEGVLSLCILMGD